MSDFVKPEIVRLPLSGGAFIDVKKRLNHGEREDLRERWWVDEHGVMQRQGRGIRTNMVLAYLIGWSLMDDAGKPVEYSPAQSDEERRSILRSLSPQRFDEIHKAIDAHEDGAPAKKAPDGATESPAISPSRSDAAGATGTSVN